MLSSEDLVLIHRGLEIISKLNLVPVNFNRETGEVKMLESGSRLNFWKLLVFFYFLLAVYKNVRMVQMLFDPVEFNLNNFTVNVMASAFFVFQVYIFVNIFYHHGREGCNLISQIHKGKTEPHQQLSLKLLQKTVTRLGKEHSWIELFTVVLPLLQIAVFFSILLVYFIDPNARFLIFSALPNVYKTWTVFVLMAIPEIMSWIFTLASSFYHGYYLMNIVPRLNDVFVGIESDLCSGATPYKLRQTCHKLRAVQVEVQLINLVYSGGFYLLKIVLLINVILTVFSGIRTFSFNPLFAVTMMLLAGGNVSFCILFLGRLYLVPERLELLKTRLLRLGGNVSESENKYLTKFLTGIQNCRFKSGSFYTIDRMTGPEFLDFCVNQIVDLLLTF